MMAKWHIRDHGLTACGTRSGLTLPITEWVKRIASDLCARCGSIKAREIMAAHVARKTGEAVEAAYPWGYRSDQNEP